MLLPAFGKKAGVGLVAHVKPLRMNRLTFLLLSLTFLVTLTTRAQTVTFSVRNAPLDTVFAQIERQTAYRFVFTSEDLKEASRISLSVRKEAVLQVLDEVFKGQPLTYRLEDHFVFIRQKGPPAVVGAQLPALLTGKVINEKGAPVEGASVQDLVTHQATVTGIGGEFSLPRPAGPAKWVIAGVNIITRDWTVQETDLQVIRVQTRVAELADVSVIVNTGYQQVNKERATGSFVLIDSTLFNRSTGTDVLSRLSGVTSGMLIVGQPSNIPGTPSQTTSIRGLSTINANKQPLVIIDNFPYDGDLLNINPNDVASVTVLKDAAAASIWGVRAGNGVIVITTKKGTFNQPARLSFNSNYTISEKPNLVYSPSISSSDYIALEQMLFQEGFYGARINSRLRTALDPVQDMLVQQAAGQLSSQEAANSINGWKQIDIRSQADKYLYQRNKNQQYALSVSGGSSNDQYYISGGLDNNDGNNSFLKRNGYRRISVNASNTYVLFNRKVELSAGIWYINSQVVNDGFSVPAMPNPYPYAQLADAHGNALPIARYRAGYIDTAGQGKLLDWAYKPLDELQNANNIIGENEYRVNVGIKYRMPLHLTAEVKYQYGDLEAKTRNLYSQQTYYTRDLINSFTQINWATGAIAYPVPLGSILSLTNGSTVYQNLRAQLGYANTWNQDKQLSIIAGTEIRDQQATGSSYSYYGYDDQHGTTRPADFYNAYPNYITSAKTTIYPGQMVMGTTNRYLSYFSNAAYTWKNRYTVSASGRNDGSNLFGVSTNRKHVPLWSGGVSWDVSKERFYHWQAMPYLKLRTTYGYQGNLSTGLSALLTTQYLSANTFGSQQSAIVNPPNPDLRWERVGQWNTGIDFSTKGDRLRGSLEYYVKDGVNLIGTIPLAPSLGLTSFQGNVAGLKGRGVDVVLHTKNIAGAFQWMTSFLFSYNTDWISKYGIRPASNSFYVNGGVTPSIGKPVNALFSYRWAGLDGAGNSQGWLNGKVSEDYAQIAATNDIRQLEYNGDRSPRFFGSLRNTFSYDQITLSFNVTYKLGYVFRRNSINYYSLFNSGYTYGMDYSKRWQQPGDERITNVPSLIYPVSSPNRDAFYNASTVLVDKGDHMRLQDIQLSYSVTKRQMKGWPIQLATFYLYANNVGLLWRANRDKIDPDIIPNGYYSAFPNPRSLSAGMKIDW